MYTQSPIIIGFLFFLLAAGCLPDDDSYETWQVYNGDATQSSFSQLDQINRENVDRLEVAWTYRTGDPPEGHPRTGIETNAIVVNDILYGASARQKIFALDAATGKEIWVFDPRVSPRQMRGVTFWESGGDRRIFFTAGNALYALNAESGEPVNEFGEEGRVNLNEGLGRDPDLLNVSATSPGIIYEDRIIMGSTVGTDPPAPGHVRAYDVRTGEMAWIFHTIPRPGQPGFETWEGRDEEDFDDRWGANSWAGMSLDKERGIVYVPTAAPGYDWYGGDRPGKNLYGNSLLALDAATGEYIWHYQVVRHDIWDYDLPAPPNLLTVRRNGEPVDAVAQMTKHGFLFVFDRTTGESLFPIEERPVPRSDIESEAPWPTQPFPLKPEPYARQEITPDKVTDISPQARDSVLEELKEYRNEGLFTPGDPRGTVMMPGTTGAGRWGGAAHDPSTGVLYLNASELPSILTVRWQPETRTDRGQTLYLRSCADCHGPSREGQPPVYPSLTDLKENWTREETVDVITEGRGRMPAFSRFSDEDLEALIAYLYDLEEETVAEEDLQDSEERDVGRFMGINPHRFFTDPDGYPAIKPPWGTLNAIDLNSGEYLWRVTLGSYPELAEEGIHETGMPSMGGPIITAGGLLFIAGTEDGKLRAFDRQSGEMLWETRLPAAGFATPSTYMSGGRQYVVIAAGGGRGTRPGDYYVAFRLPEER